MFIFLVPWFVALVFVRGEKHVVKNSFRKNINAWNLSGCGIEERLVFIEVKKMHSSLLYPSTVNIRQD